MSTTDPDQLFGQAVEKLRIAIEQAGNVIGVIGSGRQGRDQVLADAVNAISEYTLALWFRNMPQRHILSHGEDPGPT